MEHWDNAIAMGTHAARSLLAGDGGAEPFDPIPWFWSDQYDRKIQLAGRAGAGGPRRGRVGHRSTSGGSSPSTAARAGWWACSA